MTRSGRAISTPALRHKWVTVLALLAFFLQVLVVQTHIHELTPVAKAAAGLHVPAKAPPKSQDPVDQCRLCQELVHAGNFVTPLAAASPVSLSFVAASFLILPAVAITPATAFAWQSRAPPVH